MNDRPFARKRRRQNPAYRPSDIFFFLIHVRFSIDEKARIPRYKANIIQAFFRVTRLDSLLARNAWDPVAEFVTSRQWISPPPSFASSAFSHCPQLRLLVDENISYRRGVGPCRKRGIPMISVREAGLTGKVDEVVFDYAVEHKMCIVTMDRDFTGYGRFDHTQSYGVVHLPVPDGKRWRRKAVAAALSHFADNVAEETVRQRGVLIRYTTSGEFRIHLPDEANPKKSIIKDVGRFPLPPHPTKDAKVTEAGRLTA